MPQRLRRGDKVVGTRRLIKALQAGQISLAFVALDADLLLTRKVTELCASLDVPVVEIDTMQALGEAAGVAVPTASAGIKKAIV
jgi:large subunit ribosomal protein L7A